MHFTLRCCRHFACQRSAETAQPMARATASTLSNVTKVANVSARSEPQFAPTGRMPTACGAQHESALSVQDPVKAQHSYSIKHATASTSTRCSMIPNDALCESMDKARTIKESGHGIGRSKVAEVMLFCKNAVALYRLLYEFVLVALKKTTWLNWNCSAIVRISFLKYLILCCVSFINLCLKCICAVSV